MKVTFYRQGHANNSSSSHSLIFKNDIKDISTDEYEEFGWSNFTCADKDAKKNYIFACLRDSYNAHIQLNYENTKDIEYDDIEEFRKSLFTKWINRNFSEFEFDLDTGAYVDHQSAFYFPTYRDKSKGINKEFAKSVIHELLDNNYVFLGGNDNGDADHPLTDSSDRITPFMEVWYFFKERVGMVEFDNKTGEYVMCGPSNIGSLMKIKF